MPDKNEAHGAKPDEHNPCPPPPKDMRALFKCDGPEGVREALAGAVAPDGGKSQHHGVVGTRAANLGETGLMKSKEKGSGAKAPGHEGDAIRDQACYDGKIFFLQNPGGEYIPLDRRSFESHLTEMGIEDLAKVVNMIQRDRFVTVLEGYAGRPCGFYAEGGFNYLIRQGPTIIKPSAGEWDMLKNVINAIIGDDPEVGDRQVVTLLYWLKTSYEALRAGVRTPGQALVLAGPAGCGKSLLIDLIVVILGGRRGQPHKYITGRTSFNGDLLGREVLVSDDDLGSTDIRSRRGVAAHYKNLGFAGEVGIEAKYGTPRSFSPFWRLVIAANDEPESLLVLPPMSTDIADKITLLLCKKRRLPMSSKTPTERKLFFETLVAQIPAMLGDLLRMQISEEFQEDRCGVKYFHHPVLLNSLLELAPENSLLHLIDEAMPLSKLTCGFLNPWTGTAAELRHELFAHCGNKQDVQRLLPTVPITGTYLARLANNGARIQKLKLRDGTQRWMVLPVKSVRQRIQEHIKLLEESVVTEKEIEDYMPDE